MLVLIAVAHDGDYLKYASMEIRADKEVALAAITQTGEALGHASYEPNDDKEVVLAAVAANVNGAALRFDSPRGGPTTR